MITNQELHLLLVEIKGDVKSLVEKADNTIVWQKEHEEKDERRFSNLNRYAASIAAVASGIGICGAYVWQKITGQS